MLSRRTLVDNEETALIRPIVLSVAEFCDTNVSREIAVERSERLPGLAHGRAGLLILVSELQRAGLWFEPPVWLVEGVLSDLRLLAPRLGLMNGAAGVAHAMYVAATVWPELVPATLLDDFDELLLNNVRSRRSSIGWDLIDGLVGIGTYAILRSAEAPAAELIEIVLTELDSRAIRDGTGLSWEARENQPLARLDVNRDKNLGVAHGVAGVAGLIAQIRAIRGPSAILDRLLEGAINTLLRYTRPGSDNARGFQLGWCWGDLSVAFQIVTAGISADEPKWKHFGYEIAYREAQRGAELSMDACLCHGSAGCMHIFNELWQISGDSQFKAASRDWLSATLAMHGGAGIGGYVFYSDPDSNNKVTFVSRPGFLQGSCGVALALTSAFEAKQPMWDRSLLLRPPEN